MSDHLLPGVHVEEVGHHPRTILGLDASTAGFCGVAHSGPIGVASPALMSWEEFENVYGDASDLMIDGQPRLNHLAHAVRAFFDNGGRRLHVARVDCSPGDTAPSAAAHVAALAALGAIDDIAVLAVPGCTAWPHAREIQAALLAEVDNPGPGRRRLAVLEAPEDSSFESVQEWRRGIQSGRAALYFPWVVTPHPAGAGERVLPPTGFLCGIYARVEAGQSIVRAPANEVVQGALRFNRGVTDRQQSVLNPQGINCLRRFPGRGNLVWGARTTSPDPEWKYISVRRYMDYVSASIERGIQWAVFEPNAEPLWNHVTLAINAFLHNEWAQGSLPGRRPVEAYFVRCDRTTMTQVDLDQGRLVCQIGLAPLRPSEFIIFRVGQRTRPPD